jgi:hypothetical protein
MPVAKRDANYGHFFNTMTIFPLHLAETGTIFKVKNGIMSAFSRQIPSLRI